MTNHALEIADVSIERRKYRADGPDIFPQKPIGGSTDMKRIAVACAVQTVARTIWSWGLGAPVSKDLKGVIGYHYRAACIPKDTYAEVFAFIASWVPGGLDADMTEIAECDRRDIMRRCRRAAEAHEARYRNRIHK